MIRVSESLKRFRKEKHITQKKAAEVIGVSERSYLEYERGTAKISAVAILALADFFNVSTDYVLGVDSASPENPHNKDETYLLNVYRLLGKENQQMVMELANFLATKQNPNYSLDNPEINR